MTQGGAVPLTHGRPSSSDLALAGFDIFRREPATWAAWAGVSLVVSAAMMALSTPLLGDSLAQLNALQGRDPLAAGALLARASPGLAVLALLGLAFYAVMYAAVIRAMIRPDEPSWRHLRLGADELRQAAVLVAVWALVVLAYIALLLGALILAALTPPPARALLRVLLGALALAGVVAVGVRLSLASAATFDARQVRVLESWRLTRGVAWRLFGALLLSFVIVAMLGVASWMLVAATQIATGGLGSTARSPAAQAVALLVGAAVSPLNLVLLAGPPAAAFRARTRPTGPPGGRWPGAEAAIGR